MKSMSFIQFTLSNGSPNWSAILVTSVKNTGTIEEEVGLPEELDLGSFPFPTATGDDWGSFAAPLSKTTDLGTLV